MAIYIVRHGETTNNAQRVVQRPTAELSEQGHIQAQQLAKRLKGEGITRIICSDFDRTRQTCAYIETLIGLKAEFDEILRERNFGDLRGKPYAEIGQDIFAHDYAPPNGETWAMFETRVQQAWLAMCTIATQTEGNLLLVSHGLVCRALIKYGQLASGVDVPDHWGNTSLTIVEAALPHNITLLNCTQHLSESLQTMHGAKV